MLTRMQKPQIVDAGPERVFRLVSGVESWAGLLPTVRDIVEIRPGTWRAVCLWRSIPIGLVIATRVDDANSTLELRAARWPGIRIAARWVVEPAPGGMSSIRLDAEIVRAPWVFRPLVAVITRDVLSGMLDMFLLLAQSDRKAHENIEQ
jgi:ribosome-associated toxin RatA of RatAB toxin-antitoxin module